MKYFLIFILIFFPSVVFAQIRIGVLPVELKGRNIPSQFKEKIENTIYKNLRVPFQIEIISLDEKDKNRSQVHYLLESHIEFLENETEIELNLLDPSSLKTVYSVKEKVSSSEFLSRLPVCCEEIKNRVLSSINLINISSPEKKSFLSKINPLTRLNALFSRLFSKKERFNIKIPIPPPPPPPSYNGNPYLSPNPSYKEGIKNTPSKTFPDNKVYPSSPWQWF